MSKSRSTYRILEYKPGLFKIQKRKHFFWVSAFGVPLTALEIAQETLQKVIQWDGDREVKAQAEKHFKKRVWQVV
jgi:hypothetical protein